jgi:murein DD-endopeptidase MepM/ murein hydrolase activator NlpD
VKDDEGFDLILVPRAGGESRTYSLTRRRIRLLKFTGGGVLIAMLLLVGSWAFVARQASRVPGLSATIDSLDAERERIAALARRLEALEARYGDVRDLFGAGVATGSSLWIPPAEGRSAPRSEDAAPSAPDSWPLSEAGFVTRTLLADAPADHPGLDIAVPVGTYVRAAGPGIVLDVGEDPVYGLFVTLDHGDAVVTLYGHASRTFVQRGQQVRRNEVIALSGSTGRSTAPHLHFEVRRDGEALDPSTFVSPPN